MPTPANSVKAVFDQAVEIDTPADRAAFLDRACAGDPGLRDRVEGLLRAYADAGSFLDRPAAGPPETAVLDSAADPTASGSAPRRRPARWWPAGTSCWR